MVGRVIDSYEDKPKLDDQVASEGRRNIGSAGSDFDNVQHDSRLDETICLILGIGWRGGEVSEEIGTFPISSKYSASQFLAQRCFVQRL